MKRLCAAAAVAAILVLAVGPGATAAWNGGHDVMGCAAAGRTWYFAEGTTGAGFNEWASLLNANPEETTASFTFMLTTGEVVERSYTLPPESRITG